MPATERTPQGRFAPGRSGNPAGRPPGARNKSTLVVEAALAARAAELVEALVGAAKAGNAAALRICFDRVAPPRNGRPVPFALPPLACRADVVDAARRIVTGVADGELTPEEAQDLFRVVEAFDRVLTSPARRGQAPQVDAGACRQPRTPAETSRSPESAGGADGGGEACNGAAKPAAGAGPLPTGAGQAQRLAHLQKPVNHLDFQRPAAVRRPGTAPRRSRASATRSRPRLGTSDQANRRVARPQAVRPRACGPPEAIAGRRIAGSSVEAADRSSQYGG